MIGFEPLVIPLGPWTVRAFGLLALVGLGAAIAWTLRAARPYTPITQILHALAWAIPVGVLSARTVHLLGWWDYYLMHAADVPRLSLDGLSLWGGLVGGGLVAAAALRGDPQRRRLVFDLAAPGVALGIAIGRFGQFLDGYGQGVPSSLPWATQYASRMMASPDFGVPRHPAQIYDALIALALFFILSRLALPWRATTLLVTYAAASLALAPLRLAPAFLFGLQIEQMLAGLTLVVGIVYGVRHAQRFQPFKLKRHEADAVLET